jgi:molybdenum cofactor cytidylyltransferase
MRHTGQGDSRPDAILLASGRSARFSAGNKLLHPFRGKELLRWTLDLVCPSALFARLFLVYHDDRVAALAAAYPVTPLYNPCPERGLAESIRTGLGASRAPFFLFLPCDQPRLDSATLHRIVAARAAGKIVRPRCHGTPGSPCLFAQEFRAGLLSLAPHESGRDLIARHREAVIDVPVEDERVLADIDYVEDMESVRI